MMVRTAADQAASFRAGIEKLWGYGAQTRAARHWEVSDRTVRHWLSGRNPVPAGIMSDLRAMLSIAPPPDSSPDDDRDKACRVAIEPALTELRDRAVSAGWHPAEVAAALMSLTADEIRTQAGDDALDDVIDQLRR